MLFGAMFLYPDGINPNLVLLAIGMTGLVVGFAWIRRTSGPDPDKEPSFWRYRQVDKVRRPSKVQWLPTGGDARVDLYKFMQESNARARRGRATARLMIFGAVVALALPAFLFIAAPNGPQGMYLEEPQPHALAVAVPVIAFLGLVIGLAWMVRILRAHQEPEPKGWRYRDS